MLLVHDGISLLCIYLLVEEQIFCVDQFHRFLQVSLFSTAFYFRGYVMLFLEIVLLFVRVECPNPNWVTFT